MNRLNRTTIALVVSAVLTPSAVLAAAQAKPPPPAAAPAAAPARFVPPVRGQAEIGYTPPVTKRDKATGDVITTIKVKNISLGSIAGLKIEEYWWDKAGNPVSGGRARLMKPLLPGEVATLTLTSPFNPKMDRNNYTFSHANGTIKTTKMKLK